MIEEKPAGDSKDNSGASPAKRSEPITPEYPIPPAKSQQNLSPDSDKKDTEGNAENTKRFLVEIVKDDELKPFEKKTLKFAWIGLIVAILTGVVFYLQFRETQRQTKVLSQTDELEERPWIVFTGKVSVEPEIKPEAEFSIRADIRNTGKTPAMNAQACTGRTISDQEVIAQCSSSDVVQSTPVLPPGEQPFSLSPNPYLLSRAQFDAIRSGKGNFYVFGHITYCDVLDHRWITNFCARLKRDTKTFESCPFDNEYLPAGTCKPEQENKQTQ